MCEVHAHSILSPRLAKLCTSSLHGLLSAAMCNQGGTEQALRARPCALQGARLGSQPAHAQHPARATRAPPGEQHVAGREVAVHLPRRLSVSPSRHATLHPPLRLIHAAWAEHSNVRSAMVSPRADSKPALRFHQHAATRACSGDARLTARRAGQVSGEPGAGRAAPAVATGAVGLRVHGRHGRARTRPTTGSCRYASTSAMSSASARSGCRRGRRERRVCSSPRRSARSRVPALASKRHGATGSGHGLIVAPTHPCRLATQAAAGACMLQCALCVMSPCSPCT